MQWIKDHKGIIIGGMIVVVVLTAAFFLGGSNHSDGFGQGEVSTELVQEDVETSKNTTEAQRTAETDIEVDVNEEEHTEKNALEEETKMNAGSSDNGQMPVDSETGTRSAGITETATLVVTTTETPKVQSGTTEQGTTAGTENVTGTNSTTEKTTTEQATTEGTEATSFQCSITISCADILNNMDTLKPEKAGLIPDNGVILSTSVTVTEGETVYEVLRRACTNAGIPLDASAGYVKGIQNIYEFDCGGISGWKYSVNGTYPNYGCTSYVLKEGDVIQWNYVCN